MSFARLSRIAMAAFALAIATFAPAEAARLALVIGNDSYGEITPLEKAVNDARAIGDTLRKLGFDATVVTDAGRREMNRAIQEFAGSVQEGDTALFFYAGHGVEIAGRNYLLPIDTPNAEGGDGEFIAAEAIGVDELLERIRARKAQFNIVILDACRNNPFERSGTRSVGGDAGLARIFAPQGTFVMYSADVGEAALDRLGKGDTDPNSVFTRSLIPLLSDPSLDLVDTAREVRRRVRDLAAGVRHSQTPAYYDAVLGEFRFASLSDPEPAPRPADPLTEPAADEAVRAPETAARSMIATGGDKDTIRVWDAGTGVLVAELAGEKIIPSMLAFSADGHSLLVGGSDGSLFSYRLPELKKNRAVFGGYVVSAAVETQRGLLVAGADGSVSLLDSSDWSPVWSGRPHAAIVSPLLVRGESVFTASADGQVLELSLADGRVLSRIDTGRPVTDLALLGGDLAVAVHEDGTASRLDLIRSAVAGNFRVNKGWVSAVVRFGRGDGFVTAGVDGEIAFWSSGSDGPLLAERGHSDVASAVRTMTIGKSEILVSTGFDGKVRLRNRSGDVVMSMDHGSAVLHAAFHSGEPAE